MYTRAYSIDGKKKHSAPLGTVNSTVSYPSRTTIHLELQFTIPEGGDKLEADLDW